MNLNEVKRRRSSIIDDQQHIKILSLLKHTSSSARITRRGRPQGEQLQFTHLPNSIITKVFNYLSLEDLTNASLANRKMNTVYNSLIYNDLKVFQYVESYKMDEFLADFDKEHHKQIGKYGTVVSNDLQFLRLVFNLVQDPSRFGYLTKLSLGEAPKPLIFKSLTAIRRGATRNTGDCDCDCDDSRWDITVKRVLRDNGIAVVDLDPKFMEFTILDVLQLLLSNSYNLQTLSLPCLPMDTLLTLKFQSQMNTKVRDLTISLHENDLFPQDSGCCLPFESLERLHVKFGKNTEDQFDKLGELINATGTITSLKELVFEFVKSEFNEVLDTHWINFFNHISGKLQLTTLRLIGCNASTDQESISQILINCIDLPNLTELSLSISESTHKSSPHNNSGKNDKSLINYLSPHLTNLTRFEVKPSKNCISCQLKNLYEFLNSFQILSNLQVLDLQIIDIDSRYNNNANANFIDQLVDLILYKGRNLQKLRIKDELQTTKFETDFTNWLQVNEFDAQKPKDLSIDINRLKTDLGCKDIDYLTLVERLNLDNSDSIPYITLFFRKWISNSPSSLSYFRLLTEMGVKYHDTIAEFNFFDLKFGLDRSNGSINLLDSNYRKIDLFCYI